MSKIELTINVDYLQDWGLWQAVREIIQNARDAEIQYSSPMSIEYKNGRLTVSNPNVSLHRDALLLGTTSKKDNDKLAGFYGEGLKLGVLAAVRAGHSIVIRNGAEIWKPCLEQSNRFNANVLVFNIRKARVPINGISIEIDNIKKEDWLEYKSRFLFLDKPEKILHGPAGDVLLDSKHQGKLYVKGIFVQDKEDYHYGYNFTDVKVDRDRQAVISDLGWKTCWLWAGAADLDIAQASALNDGLDVPIKLFDALEDRICDLESLNRSYNTTLISKPCRAVLRKLFYSKYGEDVVPVCSQEAANKLGFFGRKTVIVGDAISNIVLHDSGGLETVLKDEANAIKYYFTLEDLTTEARLNLYWAIQEIQASTQFDIGIDDINIVMFKSNNRLGMWKAGPKRLYISNSILLNKVETLRVLIHELSHDQGADGTQEHSWSVETIWSAVYKKLLGDHIESDRYSKETQNSQLTRLQLRLSED